MDMKKVKHFGDYQMIGDRIYHHQFFNTDYIIGLKKHIIQVVLMKKNKNNNK
jgi:hypothetical protein